MAQKAIIVLFSLVACFGQQAVVVPATKATTLNGSPVVFPKPGGKVPLLVTVGFTHKSSGDLEKWNKLCTSKYWKDSRVEYYELVDLQGAPSMVRGMILHGMRKSIQGEEQAHFTPFYSDEAQWKKLTNYSQPDAVYVFLADAQGRVLWQEHGPAAEEKCKALDAAVAGLK